MDEDGQAKKDFPAFINNTIKQLLSLKADFAIIDDLHNKFEQLNLVKSNILNYSNEIKNFLTTLNSNSFEIKKAFNEKFDDYLKNEETNNKCNSNSDNDKRDEQNKNVAVSNDSSDNSENDKLMKENRTIQKGTENLSLKQKYGSDSDITIKRKTRKKRRKRLSFKNGTENEEKEIDSLSKIGITNNESNNEKSETDSSEKLELTTKKKDGKDKHTSSQSEVENDKCKADLSENSELSEIESSEISDVTTVKECKKNKFTYLETESEIGKCETNASDNVELITEKEDNVNSSKTSSCIDTESVNNESDKENSETNNSQTNDCVNVENKSKSVDSDSESNKESESSNTQKKDADVKSDKLNRNISENNNLVNKKSDSEISDSDSYIEDLKFTTEKRKKNNEKLKKNLDIEEKSKKSKNQPGNKNSTVDNSCKKTNNSHNLKKNKIESEKDSDSDSANTAEKNVNKDTEKDNKENRSSKNLNKSENNTCETDDDLSEDEIKNKPKFGLIKCIDINKLLDPKVQEKKNNSLSLRFTKLDKSINKNDSIIILSSSDSEIDVKRKLPDKSKKRQEEKRKKATDSSVNGERCTRTSRNKTSVEIIKKSFIQFKQSRERTAKNKFKKIEIITSSDSSNSDSTSDSDVPLIAKLSNRTKHKEKSSKKCETTLVDLNYNYKDDIKFKSECYVSLLRIPTEKLKEYYLQEREDLEINSLTNMKTLKRSRRQKESSSSSENEIKPTKKRSKVQKKKINDTAENVEYSDNSDNLDTFDALTEALNTEKKNDEVDLPIPEDLLNSDGDSEKQSDFSVNDDKNEKSRNKEKIKKNESNEKNIDENNKNKENEIEDIEKKKYDSENDEENTNENVKKKKNDKSTIEDEDKKKDRESTNEDEEDKKKKDKEKNKWRKDSLLRGKLSCSDSEEELIRFRNKKSQMENEVRSEPEDGTVIPKKSKTKKQLKRIARRLGSDLSSSDDEKDNKKSDDKENSNNDSESSESEEDSKKKKPLRRRIKRIKESDESSDAEKSNKKKKEDEQNTRKKIRNVWSKESLADSTKEAAKEEEMRKKRIAERQKLYNNIYVSNDINAKVDKVVLDFDEETKEELLSVHPDLVEKLKPHQAQGVRFMWTACFESLERTKKTEGSGCILAHCMGLGKTLQVITLIHTLLTNSDKTKIKTALVVCPLSTVLNWVQEFKKWLDDLDTEQVNVFDLVQHKQNYERLYQMQDWMKFGGVLVIGYDMFRNLSNPKGKRMSKKLINGFTKVLLEPGPDLVVCDEGHLLKNEKTGISIAMNRLRTKRRVVLTGTPLQNNLKEYFCMVQFVKPNLLGTYKEYLNRFVNPITNGQYTDSTPHDIQIMRRRAHVLHKMLDAVVERRDYNVLAPFLPPKHEYVLFLSLTKVQIDLYREYLLKFARNTDVKGTSFLFQDFQELQRICIHPRVLLDKSNQDKLRREMEDDDSEGSLKDFINDDESDKSTTPNETTSESDSDSEKKPMQTTRRTRANPGHIEEEPEVIKNDQEWWSKFCEGDELDNICHSSKISLLFDILHQCEMIGDKILVFSQSLYSLNLIEYFLARIDEATQSGDTEALAKVGGFTGSWALGLDYFRLDGSTSCDNRSTWCKTFNNEANTRARLFLISTRAGGLGINLVAANRVIIFDVSWNPSYDIQSIYRVYRFGQTKPCYIYRFVTLGTMENKIYERQVTKQAISKRVIDEQQIDRHYNQSDLAELYAFNPTPDEERPIPLVPKDRLFADMLQNHVDHIFKYHEHNSLLENKTDEGLNEEERRAAWEEFENEKKAPKFNLMQTMIRNGMFETLRILVQQDNNGWTPAQVNGVMPQVVQKISEQVARGDYSMYKRVEEKHEMRVLEQRRMQMIYQQYMQQLRNSTGGAPMTTADMNKLAQMFSAYNQTLATAQQQTQREQIAGGSSSTVSFHQGEPPSQVPHPAVSGIVELND